MHVSVDETFPGAMLMNRKAETSYMIVTVINLSQKSSLGLFVCCFVYLFTCFVQNYDADSQFITCNGEWPF